MCSTGSLPRFWRIARASASLMSRLELGRIAIAVGEAGDHTGATAEDLDTSRPVLRVVRSARPNDHRMEPSTLCNVRRTGPSFGPATAGTAAEIARQGAEQQIGVSRRILPGWRRSSPSSQSRRNCTPGGHPQKCQCGFLLNRARRLAGWTVSTLPAAGRSPTGRPPRRAVHRDSPARLKRINWSSEMPACRILSDRFAAPARVARERARRPRAERWRSLP